MCLIAVVVRVKHDEFTLHASHIQALIIIYNVNINFIVNVQASNDINSNLDYD